MRAKRIDANQPAIVRAFRAAGCHVVPIHHCGGGVPDLLVTHRGRWRLVEIKDGAKSPSKRALTPAERDFESLCPLDYWIAESEDDVERLIKEWA